MRAHGIEVFTLRAKVSVTAEAFAPTELSRQRATFPGHRLVKLGGTWAKAERELPAGSCIVPAGHKLARLAAQLLEAQSDDGLATWGFFDAGITRADETGEGKLSYPVLRLDAMPAMAALEPVLLDQDRFPRLAPLPAKR